MSKISVAPNASGTANFTIASPATNTDRTLTLPDATGTINTSGAVNEVPAGTASAPSIYPTGDTNTGMFFPAADTIAFAEGGTEQMRLTDTGLLQFNSGYGSVSTAYGCRAWVKFNGTGTVAINGSGNVSSITDNGTGDYTINFTNAMPDTNYAFVFGGTDILNEQSVGFYASQGSRITSPATGSVRIFTFYTNNGSAGDQVINNVAIFR